MHHWVSTIASSDAFIILFLFFMFILGIMCALALFVAHFISFSEPENDNDNSEFNNRQFVRGYCNCSNCHVIFPVTNFDDEIKCTRCGVVQK